MIVIEYIGIAFTVISVLAGIGAGYERSNRGRNLNEQGQNDITETDCEALCDQIRARYNELCLALADEVYMRERWQTAAAAAAAAFAVAAFLHWSASVALASIFGAIAAAFLYVAAAAILAFAVFLAGFAGSAKLGFDAAATLANGAREALLSAQTQMQGTCGAEVTEACQNPFPPCP